MIKFKNGATAVTGLASNKTEMVDKILYCMDCIKLMADFDGKLLTVRSCGHGGRYMNIDDKCGEYTTLKLDGEDAISKKYGCVCMEDSCNGASSLQFTYLSLLPIVIYVMQKIN